MRKNILIPSLLILVGIFTYMAGCGSDPAAPEMRDLDFTAFDNFIQTTDLPDDTMVTVRYREVGGILVVTGIDTPSVFDPGSDDMVPPQMEKVEPDSSGDKDGDDDTEIQVTWGELKALYR